MADKYITEKGQIAYAFEGISLKDWKYGCLECKNLHENYSSCSAYPNGIPDDLLSGLRMHTKIQEDQTGEVIFQPLLNEEIQIRTENIRVDKAFKILQHEITEITREINNSNSLDINTVFYRRGLIKALKIYMEAFGFEFVDEKGEISG